jgi:hypothetical protein
MGKAFGRIKAGLEDAIEYAQGDTQGRRTHQVEAPAGDVRDIGQEILEGVRAIKAHKAGKQPLTVRTVKGQYPHTHGGGPALLRIAD